MKIKEVIIHNFKSVAQDCVLNLDKRITTIIGASESGKTNVLEALNKFFMKKEFQESDICSFKDEGIDNDTYMVSVVFGLDENDDIEEISQIDERLVKIGEFTIRKRKDGKYALEESGLGERKPGEPQPRGRIHELHNDMRQYIENANNILKEFLQTLPEDLPAKQNTSKSLDELVTHLPVGGFPAGSTQAEEQEFLGQAVSLLDALSQGIQDLEGIPEEISNIIGKIRQAIEEAIALPYESMPEIDIGRLLKLCPHATYVRDSDVQLLPNSIAISRLESGDKTALIYKPLLDIAGITVVALKDPETTSRGRNLRRGERRVNEFLKLWSQEKIGATFTVDGDKFVFNVRGEEGHYGQLSERSVGFQWFLAFCLAYWPHQSSSNRSILLLDEPGLHLHASAQKDLLEQFENIVENNQIIYTTHSPFMINKNYPERIRAALKKEEPEGTLIDSKPYRATRGGCYEPVRTAIGITLGNSLFIGGRNLIVEGIADQIIVTAFSRYLAKQDGRVFMNLQDICITPAGGVDNVLYLAYLCNIENMKPVILLDSDAEGNIVYSRIEKENVIPVDRVVRVRDAGSKKGENIFELEDLIENEYYHKAVLEAYKEIPGIKFAKSIPSEYAIIGKSPKSQDKQTLKEDQSGNKGANGVKGNKAKIELKGMTKVYNDYFRSKDWGSFDKVLVARKISEKLDNEDLPGDATVLKFEKLFKEINNKISQNRE